MSFAGGVVLPEKDEKLHEEAKKEKLPYRQLVVGSMIYPACQTSLEMKHAVSIPGKFMSCYTQEAFDLALAHLELSECEKCCFVDLAEKVLKWVTWTSACTGFERRGYKRDEVCIDWTLSQLPRIRTHLWELFVVVCYCFLG